MTNTPMVTHQPEDNLFLIQIAENMAYQEYFKRGDEIVITHTEVPKELEGKGLGSLLAKNALKYTEENGLKLNPVCPFMAAYVRKHFDEYKHLISPEFKV